MKIYFYKLTSDNGGAPCVQDGLVSLAICKPMIRSTAEPGDLIFGFAANSLHRDNRLVYVAVVTSKVSGRDYYGDQRRGGRGDRIYRFRGDRFYWRRAALHHGPGDLAHDLGEHPYYNRAYVLLSRDFRYFGANGKATYKTHYPLIGEAVEGLGRGYKVHHEQGLRDELLHLKERVWSEARQEDVGRPTSAPSRSINHRSRSCGVVRTE